MIKKKKLLILNGYNTDKVILVCHSMGGLIVRRWIVDEQSLLARTSVRIGLLLVASPSDGSYYANLLSPISALFGNIQSRALRTSSMNDWIRGLDQAFFNLKEDNILPLFGKELIEEKPLLGIRILNVLMLRRVFSLKLVSDSSAARYFGHPLKIENTDHNSIAKPTSVSSDQHKALIKFCDNTFTNDPQAANLLRILSSSEM